MQFLTWDQIVVGSVWEACDGSGAQAKVVKVNPREVWYKDASDSLREKDPFSFQCRYYQVGVCHDTSR